MPPKLSLRSIYGKGWSSKENALMRFMSFDGRLQLVDSIPIVVRCMLIKAVAFGLIGSLSYVIGASIRGDFLYPNCLAIFTGGLVAGCTSGVLLYLLPSFSFSNASRVVVQALILQVFVLSILAFVATPSIGSYLLKVQNTWDEMLVNQFIGVGFVLIILIGFLFLYRYCFQNGKVTNSNNQQLPVDYSIHSNDNDENQQLTIEMNPLNIAENKHENRRTKLLRNRPLPFIRRQQKPN